METAMVVAGIAFIGAAIAGGGLVAFRIEIPLIDSLPRQLMLGAFGLGLLAFGLLTEPGRNEVSAVQPAATTNPDPALPAGDLRSEIANEPSPEPLTWFHNPATDHYYAVTASGMSWEQLNLLAQEQGGYLASIGGGAEEEWLVSRFGSTMFWIGLSDLASEDEWEWTSGEPVTFVNWCPGEPTDVAAGFPEDAVHVIPWQSCWNDENIHFDEFFAADGQRIPGYPGVIEIDHPPA